MKNCLFVLLLLIFIGCHKTSTESIPTDSELFTGYMNKTFNFDVSNKNTTFLLIPCTGCQGCSDKAFLKIEKGLIDSGTIIIICNERRGSDYDLPGSKNKIYYDQKNIMANYTFGTGYPALIKMNNKLISNIKYFSPLSNDTCIKF